MPFKDCIHQTLIQSASGDDDLVLNKAFKDDTYFQSPSGQHLLSAHTKKKAEEMGNEPKLRAE